MALFKKNWFFTVYTHIFKGHNSLINCPIDLKFFPTCRGGSNEHCLLFENYHFPKTMRQKCQKMEFWGGHLGILAAILDWQWILFNLVFYIRYRSFLPILLLLSQSARSIYQLPYFLQILKMKTGNSYLSIFPLIPNKFW